MPLSARLEWWTEADAATAGSLVGDWKICAADPGAPDTFRVHASSAQPDRLHAATHPPGASGDPDTLWRHATGPARVETLLADRAIAVTDIDMAGDLRTRTLVDATPALLALHADVVDAVLTRRATGVARALAEFPDAALMPAIDAWFTARLSEG
jgi:hypothetical protein